VAQTAIPQDPSPTATSGHALGPGVIRLISCATTKRLRDSRTAGVKNHHQCRATPPDAFRRSGHRHSAISNLIRFAVSWIARHRDGAEIHETLHILNPERRNIVA